MATLTTKNFPILIDILEITKDIIRLRVRSIRSIRNNPYHAHYLTFTSHEKYLAFVMRQYLDRPKRRVYVRDVLTDYSWLYHNGEKIYTPLVSYPVSKSRQFFTKEYKCC